jgi:hypothetical protein
MIPTAGKVNSLVKDNFFSFDTLASTGSVAVF